MAKAKTIKLRLKYQKDSTLCELQTASGQYLKLFCARELERYCPALVKDLEPGQSRKLVLTQTARGINLETCPPGRRAKP